MNSVSAQLSNLTVDQIHEIKELAIYANIKAVAKDTCNQVWVGADNGLYRFDGKKVAVFDFSYVKAVKRLQNEQIAVLTDEGLFSISTLPYSCNIDTLLLASDSTSKDHLFFPKSLYEDKYGTLWIGEGKDIVRFKDRQIRRFKLGSNEDGFLHRSFEFVEDGYGQLWSIAYDGQLWQYNFEQEAFTRVKEGIWNDVSAASSRGDNEIWIGARDGVHQLILGADGSILSTRKIASIPDVSQIKWLGEYAIVATWGNGMYEIDAQGNGGRIDNFRYAQIFDFTIEENEIWIASRENISCVQLSPVELVAQTRNKFIPSVNLLKGNRLIINTGESVYLTTPSYAGLIQELIFTTQQAFWINNAILAQDTLWMTTSKGIYNFNTTTQELQLIVPKQGRDWKDKIFLDSKGVVWISGKAGKPVISITNGTVRYWEKIRKCLSVFENEQGEIFAAGANGMIFKKTGQDFEPLKVAFFPKDKLTINTFQFANDQLFLATDKGLWTIPVPFVQSSSPSLIFEGNISSLAFDQYDNLWFSHNQGLTALQMRDSVFLHFNRSNGLPSKHIIPDGLIVDVDQQIWINTSKGVAKAAIQRLTQSSTPQPYISDLYFQNKRQLINGSFLGVFQTGQLLSLNMSALTFPTTNVRYRLTLSSKEEVQYQLEAPSLLSLPDLKPGNYTLQVAAKQSHLQWSKPVSYTLVIRNPWHKTLWFYTLITFGAIGFIAFVTRLYNRQLRRANERLELIVAKRTENIERQKNDLIENKNQIIAQQKKLFSKIRT